MTHRYVCVVLIAALSGTFLLGAPCGGQPSSKNFVANAIIIPMDNCYQRGDNTASNQTVQCNGTAGKQALDNGILRAYGLVYLLIRKGVTVYWTISPTKASTTDLDVTVSSGSNANVVTHWDWTNKVWSPTYFTANTVGTITYEGGPFIVDGVDATTVQNLISTDPDFALFRTEGTIDLHQSSAPFTATQVRPLVGPPPKVAILDVASAQTNMDVMHNYVSLAGLDTPGCAGGAAGDCAGGVTATGGCTLGGACGGLTCTANQICLAPSNTACLTVNSNGGRVYDILCDNDFAPNYASSKLRDGGYALLWSPHWQDSRDPATTPALATTLRSISDFVDAGNNVFAECQAITTLEGGSSCATGVGTPATRFQSTLGWGSNEDKYFNGGGTKPVMSQFSSPNMQIGDFVFTLVGGCTTDYAPQVSGGSEVAWRPGVIHFMQGDPGTGLLEDVYSMTRKDNDPTKGLAVYLGGHNYGAQNAGTRLVLNSLFNLGIPCVSPNTACSTGLLGVCAAGTLQCAANGGLTCVPSVQPSAEICDGLDNNCNGQVDEGLTQACYTGDAGTANVGVCHGGTSICSNGLWGPCQGEVLPSPEVCNGLDDNCNNQIDEGLVRNCYDGPPGTKGIGVCDGGTQVCAAGTWGTCAGEVLPSPEICDGLDNNCNGQIDEGGVCGACQAGQTQSCYDGPPSTRNVGICHDGLQQCVGGGWGPCQGERLPGGSQCNGKDNNCDGTVDTGPCAPGFQCNNGACVPAGCGGEIGTCPPGYQCNGTQGCIAVACGDGGTCPPGNICTGFTCSDPCAGIVCGTGSSCQAGQCVSAICYIAGCPTGQLCLNGQCVTDPCSGVICPGGTFCRDGDCVQSCAYQNCDGGTTCSIDGFCEPVSTCSPVCGTGQICSGGQCAADPCAGITCGKGQVCNGGACVDDPCTDAKCPFNKCAGGQCPGPVPLLDAGLSGATFDGGNGNPGIGVKHGCGCGSASGFEVFGLMAIAGLFLFRPRRAAVRLLSRPSVRVAKRLGAGASLWALLLGLGGCGTHPGPSPDGGGGPPPITCTGTAKACGTVCVDVSTSLAHCGACDTPCEVGFTCNAGHCSFADQNPYLASVTPGTVTAGSIVTLTLAGQRFAAGATVRLSGSGVDAGIDGERALDVRTSIGASVDGLDLSGAQAATIQVRVLNPSHLASNAQAFTVLSGDGGVVLQPPVITMVSPSSAPSNAVSAVSISGNNFQPSCIARLSGGGLASPKDFNAVELGSSTLYVSALDLNGVAPGTNYQLNVITAAGTSNGLPFTVVAPPPTLTSISPTHSAKATVVNFIVTGNNFDNTATLEIVDQAQTVVAIPTTYVSPTQLSAGPLDLTSYAVGNYGVFVRIGALDSNQVGFVVDSNDPSLVSDAPGSGRQDQTVTVTLGGAGFFNTATVTLSSPVGLIQPMVIPSTWVNAATLKLVNWSLTALPIGSYNLVVTNPGSNPSGAVSFSVLQGQPVITAINPVTAHTNTVVSGTVTGQYLYTSSVVYVNNGTQNTPLPSSFDAGIIYVTSDLTGVPPGSYTVTVQNPGPLTSNAKPFTVTP